MSFKIPQIPESVSTAGANPPATPVQPAKSQHQTTAPAANEEAQVAEITFQMPIHILQAFQAVVQKTGYLEGQENWAILQAIDLWLQATSQSLDGNYVAILSKDGQTSHLNLNPQLSPEEFQNNIIAFHEARRALLEKAQAEQSAQNSNA